MLHTDFKHTVKLMRCDWFYILSVMWAWPSKPVDSLTNSRWLPLERGKINMTEPLFAVQQPLTEIQSSFLSFWSFWALSSHLHPSGISGSLLTFRSSCFLTFSLQRIIPFKLHTFLCCPWQRSNYRFPIDCLPTNRFLCLFCFSL